MLIWLADKSNEEFVLQCNSKKGNISYTNICHVYEVHVDYMKKCFHIN